MIFFGDAATETGVFHESVNFAAVHHLPVLFVCENNLYSVNTPLDVRQPGNRTIAELARGHGIRTSQHDGQLVETVEAAAADVIAGMRDNVIHDYFGVKLEIVWAVVQKELPKLRVATDALLNNS